MTKTKTLVWRMHAWVAD